MSHIKLKNLLQEVHQDRIDEGIFDIFKKIFPSKRTSLKNLTQKQREILDDYTRAGYHHINLHLRRKYGTTDILDRSDNKYDPNDIDNKIELISSAFTKDNTNRGKITVYTGIPPEFGEKLTKSIGQTFNFSGFTSTSLDRNIALNFGELYSNNRNEVYILKCVCPPHTTLDIQTISHNKQEKEQLINYGAKFKVLSYNPDAGGYKHDLDIYESKSSEFIVHEITIKLLGEQVFAK